MKINIGSGKDVKPGYDNLDTHNNHGANIISDLNILPLPIKSNTYDEVLCSHVLEDFIKPYEIMDELIRISNNKIIIRVPADTNLHQGNIRHVYHFTLHKLLSYAQIEHNYAVNRLIKVKRYKYYAGEKTLYTRMCASVRNWLGYRLVESTFIKHLFPCCDIEIVYEKVRI